MLTVRSQLKYCVIQWSMQWAFPLTMITIVSSVDVTGREKKRLEELRSAKSEYRVGFWNVNSVLLGGLGNEPEIAGICHTITAVTGASSRMSVAEYVAAFNVQYSPSSKKWHHMAWWPWVTVATYCICICTNIITMINIYVHGCIVYVAVTNPWLHSLVYLNNIVSVSYFSPLAPLWESASGVRTY